jgi:hypothetical protein
MLGAGVQLLAVMGLWAVAPAEDGEPAFVAVLPVQSASGLTEDRSAMVLDTARGELPNEALIVIPQDHVASGLAAIAGSCGTPAECQKTLAARLDAKFLFQVQVEEPNPQDFDVTVRVLDPFAQTEIASFDESCTICSEADLKRIVQERTLDAQAALLRHLNPDEDEDSQPEIVQAPVETKVEVRVKESSPLIPAGWGLVGGGAVAAVGGAVLLGLTGSDAGCPADPRGGSCIPLVYETLVPGVITAGVGVALVATGAALIVVGKKKNSAGETNTARVGFGPGSVVVQGRF